ncbi:MAG: isoprenylcysteine carboxylmethyltransferase family protein [Deltaproteobacteria bacterium]|nr:isoprenylcysteine carboxylmethyltransferase family protein [Deltaproteobacteria bacterium]NNK86365.1 isoprenylcysteine carboxylmethyltransferase family protein [Desulfobacterales bacterium]
MAIAYIIISIILILLSFLVFRVVVRKDYLNKGKLSAVSYILEILIFALHANFAYVFLPVDWPDMPPFPDNRIIAYSSTVTIVVGLIILIYAFLNLGYQGSLGMDKNKLNTNGIYQHSRNPQLVGYGMVLFGFFILYSSWYSLGWFLVYLIISYFMIKSEEEFLKMKYKEEYKEYCKNVPRVIRLFW